MEETQNDFYDPASRLTQDKNDFLAALKASMGIVSEAAKMVNISRRTHQRWCNSDKDYKEAVDQIREDMIDIAETALHGKIKAGDMIAILFYLKTIGRTRGYIEKKVYEVEGLEKIKQSQQALAAAAGLALETDEDDTSAGEPNS